MYDINILPIFRKFLLFFFLLIGTVSHAIAQQDAEKKYDTIYKLGRGHIVCNISSIGSSVISYRANDSISSPGEIKRKQVQRIVYKSGRIEVFNEPLVMMVDETSWESVWVTDKPDDVAGLHEVEKFVSESASDMRSIKAARRSATIRLQKRAAAQGANVVLITHSEARGGFGDMPSYYIEGIGYSFTPLQELE